MSGGVRILCLVLCSTWYTGVVTGAEYRYGNIQTCDVKYVEPGSDFMITCRTDHGVLTRMYTPGERDQVPTGAELERRAQVMSNQEELVGERTTTINEYEDATKGEDDGYYTCIVFHGHGHDPSVSVDECLVIIKDLCEDSDCAPNQKCVPDYDEGTYECVCENTCQMLFSPICSTRCEQYLNECLMDFQSCEDGLTRAVGNIGMCPGVEKATVREISEDIIADDFGETVVLTSGVIEEGVPAVVVVWEFLHEDGDEPVIVTPDADPFQLTVNRDNVGVYRITITQCGDEENAIVSEYRVSVKEEDIDMNVKPNLHYTCSIFPGGGIEGFDGQGSFYDLACTHVLAADFRPGGDYTNPWFVYGTFDQRDGKTALSHMTFYMGSGVFEVERGWIVHQDGVKLVLEEGVSQEIEDCTVLFEDLHIKVDCPHFTAMYDGVMSGHVVMKPAAEEPFDPLEKKRSNVGLCFDNRSGRRPNWQVGRTDDNCEVDTTATPCPENLDVCQLEDGPLDIPTYPPIDWTRCGAGASVGCGELRCDGNVPTPMQLCALEQAKRVTLALKTGNTVAGADPSCPSERCDWLTAVVDAGCPQDFPPHNCA